MRSCLTAIRYALPNAPHTQYHFWVDFQGLLYLDDQQTHRNPRNQIRDRKFIEKLYQSLKPTGGAIGERYPYVGEFWGERNCLRSAISPVVFTALQNGHLEFSLGLTQPFKSYLLTLDAQNRFSYPFSNGHITIKDIFSNQLTAEVLGEAEECNEGVRIQV